MKYLAMKNYQTIRFLGVLLLGIALVVGYFAWLGFQKAAVIVEWNTASELDMAGFNLYRSTSQGGPFEKVNSQLIPASVDPLAGGSYLYTDEQAFAGQMYYYELEAIEITGESERFGPIEVRAESGGKIELALTLVLAAAGALLLVLARQNPSGDSSA